MNCKIILKYTLLLVVFTFIGCKNNSVSKTDNADVDNTVSISEKKQIQDILGKWHWQSVDKSQEFTLKIKSIVEDTIYAQYCAVSDYGNKLDCDFDDKSNIKGRLLKNKATLQFYSFFSSINDKGKAEITIIDGNTIEWKILSPPNGEYHCPMKCILKKEKITSNNFSEFLEKLPILNLPIKLNALNEINNIEDTFFYFEKDNDYFELESLKSLGYFKIDDTIYILYKFSLLGEGEGFANKMLIMSSFKSNGEYIKDIILQGDYGGEGNADIYSTKEITNQQIVVNKTEEHYGVDTGLDKTISVYKTLEYKQSDSNYNLTNEVYNCYKAISFNDYFATIENLYNTQKDNIYGYSFLAESVVYCNPINKQNLNQYNNIAYYFEQSNNHKQSIYLLEKIIEKFPDRIVAYLNLADAQWGINDKENAKKNYNKYIYLMKSENKDLSKIPQTAYDRSK